MIRSFKERRDSDEGFTLIELMVVVLIIGILLAIAVPTFLNAQNNAKTKAATSNLRTALSSVKTVYADLQTYATAGTATTTNPIDPAVLEAAEPSFEWLHSAAADSPEKISFVGNATTMALATRSKLGTCFVIIDSVATVGGGTNYYKSNSEGNASCTASLTAPTVGAAATAYTTGSSPSEAKW